MVFYFAARSRWKRLVLAEVAGAVGFFASWLSAGRRGEARGQSKHAQLETMAQMWRMKPCGRLAH